MLTIIKVSEEKNMLGQPRKISRVQGVISPQTVLHESDILLIYGHIKDIERLLRVDVG